MAGAGLPREIRHGDYRDPSRQRHRPGQDRRLGRPRQMHYLPGARRGDRVPVQGRDALPGPCRRYRRSIRPGIADRQAAPRGLQYRRHSDQPRRSRHSRARVPARRADHLRARDRREGGLRQLPDRQHAPHPGIRTAVSAVTATGIADHQRHPPRSRPASRRRPLTAARFYPQLAGQRPRFALPRYFGPSRRIGSGGVMLSPTDHAMYRSDGFIVLPDILTREEVEALRRVTEEFVRDARSVAANDEIYDLEDSHSAAEPRVRRIKAPHLHHPEYAKAARHPKIVKVLKDLWGTVRFDTGKLNMKSAGFGAPVEWHQDWAFYPHTNDDLAAVGIMLDDCDIENGPMMVIPGSHLGPVYDHHGPDGRFCGALDPDACGLDLSPAVPCLGKAGSITVHHVRAVHGSATNFSRNERRVLLFNTARQTPGRCSALRAASRSSTSCCSP